jgi:hypothetical protein
MKIALRRDAASDATTMQRFACAVIKARLVSQYCHGGIIIKGDLYHATATHGLHKIEAGQWTPDRWDVFDLGIERDAEALALFEKHAGMNYDWFSLLAFVGPRVSDETRVYCFEWAWWSSTGEVPTVRITPEMLILLSAKKVTRG